jgi:CRISPR-associated protein Csd1
MLLQKLKEYAEERMEAPPPPLYNETPIGYIVEIDGEGRPLSPRPTATANPSTPRSRRGIRMSAPDIVRSSGIKPLLLADQSEYTFGRARDPAKQTRTDEAHRAYLTLLAACGAATSDPAVLAVQSFFSTGGPTQLEFEEDFDLSAKVTFRVHAAAEAVFPINQPAVQRFWAQYNDPSAAGAEVMQCLTCSQERPVLDVLQAKVKGIRGGQTAGTSIISANAEAFESYGLKSSLIAPTCADCGEKFTRALNELIAGESSHLYVGDSTFAFWTRERVEFDFARFISNPEAADVQALLDSVRTGRAVTSADSSSFYAVALSGSGGRAVVRDWIDTTVGEAAGRIARWFELQRIVDAYGEEPRPLGIYALAVCTVRLASDLPVTTPRALLRAAFSGTPLNMAIAFEAVRRNRAEQTITRPRAALIKLVLLSQEPDLKEDYMVALEADHPDIGYQCGRLLAVLEQVQRAALPNANATIIDRFFGTASSAPASVFARLLRGAQPHLSKLERDRPGAHGALQRQLEEVLAHIPGRTAFPKTLSLQQQALFSLGYYHQRAHDRAQAMARREAANPDRPNNSTEDSDD